MISNCLLVLPHAGAAFHRALNLWCSLRKTRLFPLFLKNLRGLHRKTRDDQLLRTKAELGSRLGEPSDGEQLGWAGGRPCSLPVHVAKQPISITSSITYFVCLLVPRGGLPGVMVGSDPAALGGEGWGGGAPQVLPVLVFAALRGCCSSAGDQGRFQTE